MATMGKWRRSSLIPQLRFRNLVRLCNRILTEHIGNAVLVDRNQAERARCERDRPGFASPAP